MLTLNFKKLGMSLFLIAVFYFISGTSAIAATYFVDFTAGNDNNAGTSSSSPWKHSPGDTNATYNANKTLSAGDTVVFKGGVVYSGQVSSNHSGTSDSPITYISGHRHSTPWTDGTTQAILDGGKTRKFGFYITHAYITIDGMEIRNIGAPTSDAAGINFEQAGANYEIVQYCTIHDINESASYTIGYGIENNHGSNHIYRYNEIYNTSDKSIELYGGTTYGSQNANNCEIYNNYIHDGGVHCVVLTGVANKFYNNIVENCQCKASFPNPGYGLKVDEGGENLIYNNLFINVNSGLGVLIGYNNKFYNNTIYGVGNNDGGTHGSNDEACINLFDNGGTGLVGHKLEGNEFINNVCHYVKNIGTTDKPKFIYFKYNSGKGNLIKNNSFYGASGNTMDTAGTVRVGSSYYSLTQLEDNFNTYEGGSGNVASGNMAGDQSLAGGSLDSLTNLPTGWNSGWTSPNNNGLDVNSNSDIIGAGLDLYTAVQHDITGAVRPQSLDFTIGAYENRLRAPSNLHLINSN